MVGQPAGWKTVTVDAKSQAIMDAALAAARVDLKVAVPA